MTTPAPGAIDCDIHPALPSMQVLVPYLDEYWRAHVTMRGLERDNYTASAFPPNAPINARPDWKPAKGNAGTDFAALQAQALDAFRTRYAICNVLHGAQAIFSEDLSAAFCRAINDWVAKEWLDKDDRLRASIVVPMHSPELAAREVERVAADPRFVQVLVWEMGELPLGRRIHWPLYRVAEQLDLPIGIHAGSQLPPSADQSRLAVLLPGRLRLVVHRIRRRAEFPDLRRRVRRIPPPEGGADGIRRHLAARLGCGAPIRPGAACGRKSPWLEKSPADYAREHVRLTIQPLDAPPRADQLQRIIEEIGSDEMLLFSTDYPHWHYEGTDAVPAGLPDHLLRKILVDNALKTYSRLAK